MPDSPGPRPADGPADRPADDDDVFADLVARFREEPTDHPWPEAEDLTSPGRPSPTPAGATGQDDDGADADGEAAAAGGDNPEDTPPGREPLGRDGVAPPTGWRIYDVSTLDIIESGGGPLDDDDPDAPAEDEDDHYVPPPPPPVPRPKPITAVALGAIVVGVLIIAVPALVDAALGGYTQMTGVLLVLGGVGTLIARMRDRPPTDEAGPDDGAVV
ncbi:MAG: hypothetical protein IRZ08_18665 [Frankia sp.]|nr:hypothetical protein [Frankia sp.]